jgi:hypothetical protein
MIEIESPRNQLPGLAGLIRVIKARKVVVTVFIAKRLLRKIWQPKTSCVRSDRQPTSGLMSGEWKTESKARYSGTGDRKGRSPLRLA